MARVPREGAGPHEAVGARVADEERRHHQVQLVGQPGGQELGVDLPAPLDHQPSYASPPEVLRQARGRRPGHLRRPRSRPTPQAGTRRRDTALRCAVDDLLAVAGREEARRRVQPAASRHRHLHRVLAQPARPAGTRAVGRRAPAAGGCRGARSRRRPGSRRRRPGRRRPAAGRRRSRAPAARGSRRRGSRRSRPRS